MKRLLKIILILAPLAGIAIGYAAAYLTYHGLLERWRPLGNPGEKIASLGQIRNDRELLVTTAGGKSYSFQFHTGEQVPVPLQPEWQIEPVTVEDLPSLRFSYGYYGMDFYTWPPLFKIQQTEEMEYIYHVEGKGQVKFALDPSGDLWMWRHQGSGMSGLVFFFYPIFGFVIGLVVLLAIAVAVKVAGANRAGFNRAG